MMSSIATLVCRNFMAIEATSLTCLSMSSLRASSEPAAILRNNSSHSSLVGGGMRERSDMKRPTGSSESLLEKKFGVLFISQKTILD